MGKIKDLVKIHDGAIANLSDDVDKLALAIKSLTSDISMVMGDVASASKSTASSIGNWTRQVSEFNARVSAFDAFINDFIKGQEAKTERLAGRVKELSDNVEAYRRATLAEVQNQRVERNEFLAKVGNINDSRIEPLRFNALERKVNEIINTAVSRDDFNAVKTQLGNAEKNLVDTAKNLIASVRSIQADMANTKNSQDVLKAELETLKAAVAAAGRAQKAAKGKAKKRRSTPKK